MMTEKNPVVLIVDDSPVNLRVFVDILERSRIKTLIAQSGVKALQRLERIHPDLILLDIMMPDLDGFETCKRLKANEGTRDIPVIFITALSETVDRVRGFDVGGVDYITKPVQPEEVLARVNAHLTIRKLQQKLEAQNALLEDKNALLENQNVLLQKKNEQLQTLNASKDKFFGIVAHDLRNPFTSLLGFTRFAVENSADLSVEEYQEMMSAMNDSAEHLYALLENLLTWSRIQRGILEYSRTRFDLKAVIDGVMELFDAHAGKKQITITSSVQQALQVYADRDIVEMIVRNLLSNAIKFTEVDGAVDILAEPRQHVVEIAVIDTGVGISPEELGKLFQIDSRVKSVGTAGEEGTGLGLILCKELLRQNGCDIWVESEEDLGSAFRFTLPLNEKGQEHDYGQFF